MTFVPDIPGAYRVQLIVNDGLSGQRQIKIAGIVDGFDRLYPAAGMQAEEANWDIGGGLQNVRHLLYAAALFQIRADQPVATYLGSVVGRRNMNRRNIDIDVKNRAGKTGCEEFKHSCFACISRCDNGH